METSKVTGPEHFKQISNTHNTKLIVKYQQDIFDIISLLAQIQMWRFTQQNP
jgi:hypothetical protein